MTPPLRAGASRLVEAFLPERAYADHDLLRRSRLLVAFCFVAAPVGLVFVALALLNYRIPALVVATLIGTASPAVTPWVLRRTGSIFIASSLMLSFVAGTVLWVGARVESQPAATVAWLAIVPLLGATLAGRRAGVVWTVICILLLVPLVVTETTRSGYLVPPERERMGSAASLALLILFISSFALLHESVRLRAAKSLAEAQARLETAREKALLAERLASLGRMAAGVAHEINNPMTFVAANVSLLHEDLARGPLASTLQREYVEDILPATTQGIRRVIAIAGDLRRFARGEAPSNEPFDMNEEIRTSLRMCEKWLLERRLTLRLGDLPPVVGQARDVGQIVVNLVVNAAQAVPAGGEIRVETSVDGADVVLRVIDDGTGMTPAVKARLFEPFFTTKPAGEGTGLGLAVVHGIVHARKGSVRVESEPGRGSTFEVRLPIAGDG